MKGSKRRDAGIDLSALAIVRDHLNVLRGCVSTRLVGGSQRSKNRVDR